MFQFGPGECAGARGGRGEGTILTEESMQDVTVARLESTRVQTPLSLPLLNVMYGTA
jgi:hypothetical protein